MEGGQHGNKKKILLFHYSILIYLIDFLTILIILQILFNHFSVVDKSVIYINLFSF